MIPSLNLRPWTYLFSVILSFWVHFFMLTGIMSGILTDSKFSHFAWANQSRKEGGLSPNLKLPLITNRNMQIPQAFSNHQQEHANFSWLWCSPGGWRDRSLWAFHYWPSGNLEVCQVLFIFRNLSTFGVISGKSLSMIYLSGAPLMRPCIWFRHFSSPYTNFDWSH